jgi:hypothetical protein
MKLTTREDSKNYACSIVEIKKIFPIENADNIVRTVINGNNVVISKDVIVGSKMLYFCSGTKLSEMFCYHNNLYDKQENNLDDTKKGFISFKQRRVKALKLRGIISDGMLLSIPSLSYLNIPCTLKLGDEFTDINDVNICEKYIVYIPVSKNNNKQQKSVKLSRLIDNQFYLHDDTDNLRKNIHKLNPDDIVGIHYKKHGTSIVIGNVQTKRQLSWIEKIAKKLKIKIDEIKYDIVYSSRKVIKNGYLNPTQNEGYYGEDIWGIVAKEVGHLIPKNWTLYGEVLGYTPSGNAIQGKYDYGCKTDEHKFYVYKISVVNTDGNVIYLTDKQIGEYCEKTGLLYNDTFIHYGVAKCVYPDLNIDNHWHENFIEKLEKDFNEKNCCMCVNKVPEEGIILRIEKLEQYEAYKLKSKRFLLMESDEQEKEISNIEDNQDE